MGALRALLISTVVAILAYLYLKMAKAGGAPAPKRILPDDKKQKKITGKSGKKVAPQKADVFTSAVCTEFPDISEEEARSLFPRKFEAHGHVVVMRLNEGKALEAFKPLAKLFAESFLPIVVDVVLLDVEGIIGELRRPKLETLYQSATALTEYQSTLARTVERRWCDNRHTHVGTCVPAGQLRALVGRCTTSATYTTHVENGVMYSFDVQNVMFSSGNTTERMHFATIHAPEETVVDMFCGIGYFTLPLAMRGGVAVIHALEKNPDSVNYLKLNAILNKVDHLVRPQCGDNREIGNELTGKCDRVLMGYIPSCKSFLPRAVSFLRLADTGRPKGVVHYHFLADKKDAEEVAVSDLTDELGGATTAHVRLEALRCVKSYAPKRFHFVADFVFE